MALALTGCARSATPPATSSVASTPSAVTGPPPLNPNCLAVQQPTIDAIGNGLKNGITLNMAAAYLAPGQPVRYYIAAQLNGGTLPQSGSVAVFATATNPATGDKGSLYAVDPVAKANSTFPAGSVMTPPALATDPAVREATGCLPQ